MTSGPPKFSVIISNYNYGRFVRAAIASVLDQTLDGVECIVVDDGSTDNSVSVISSFQQVRLISQPNKGQTSAVRTGLDAASGEVVLFLDSDDQLYRDACRKIYAVWSNDVSAIQFHLDKIDLTGKRIGSYPVDPLLETGHRRFVLRNGYIPCSPMSGNAYSRTFAAACLSRELDSHRKLPTYVDGYLISMAPLYGNIKIIREPLGSYLVHGANQSPAGGAVLSKVKRQFLINIEQKDAAVCHLKVLNIPRKSAKSYLSPYDWRNLLLIRRGYPEEIGLPSISILEALARGLRAIAVHPNMSLYRRIKNLILLPVIAFGPKALARHLLPQT